MPIDIRTSLPAALVALGCLTLVTVRVATAPGLPPRRAATDAERREIASEIAVRESTWIVETAQNFPEDLWSARDDFHGRELRRAVELANAKGVRIEDVLRAIDDDIHLRAAEAPDAFDPRSARAVPCKPRPFYD